MNSNYLKRLFLIIVNLLFFTLLFAKPEDANQSEAVADPFAVDTVIVDSLAIDTTRTETDLDTIVNYAAENVDFTFNPRITILEGKAEVSYQTMDLKAHRIKIYWENDSLVAEGRLDTVLLEKPLMDKDTVAIDSFEVRPGAMIAESMLPSMVPDSAGLKFVTIPLDTTGSSLYTTAWDSAGKIRYTIILDSAWIKVYEVATDGDEARADTIVWRDLPLMHDSKEDIEGERMFYNIKSRKGRIIEGDTKYEDGFCHGITIKKVEKDVLNIRNGIYTTCDLKEPHYHFWARDLKLIVKDKVVARPVVLHFGPVPVAIIPFAIFPARGGRHSGIIIPTYGESASQGRFFRDLGYYWAPNDYFDAKTSLDFYERYGIMITGNTRYVKRYRFNGNLSGSLINKRYSSRVDKRWHIRGNHRHNLSESATLNVSGEYQSDASYRKELSYNPYERMKRVMDSKATYSKRWIGTPYSGSVNVSHHEQLNTGEVTQWLPQVSFSRSRMPIFPQPEDADPEDAKWFNQLYFSYRGSGKLRKTVEVDKIYIDNETSYRKLPWKFKSGVQHDLTFTTAQKPFAYFSTTQTFRYSETWVDDWLRWYRDSRDQTPYSVKQESNKARRTFSVSTGLSTTLYGLFHPRLFGIEALRHKLDPSVSFTYKPDFSDPYWGYYDKFWDYNYNRELKKDRFSGCLHGGTPSSESMSMGISVGNLFQYKRIKEDKEIKGDLFDLNLNTSHDFAADSLKWGSLGSLLKFSPRIGGKDSGGMLSRVSVNLRGTHSFYAQEIDTSGRRVVVNEPAPNFLRLINFDFDLSFKLGQGGFKSGGFRSTYDEGSFYGETEWLPEIEREESGSLPAEEIESEKKTTEERKIFYIPWDAGVGFHYSENHNDPDNIIKHITTNLNLSLDVTSNWKVSYNTNIDLDRMRVTVGSVSIHRDLHCWEGIFNWTIIGAGKGYYLRIGIKSPQLQDVKVEKQKGRSGLFGY